MEAKKDAHNRRIDANVGILQALLRRQPEMSLFKSARRAATVVQKHARTYNAKRLYVQKRDESRRKALLENRLTEAETQVQAKDEEIAVLRQDLAKQQQLRAEAEELAASLQQQISALKADASKSADAGNVSEQLTAEVDMLKSELASLKERHAEELRYVASHYFIFWGLSLLCWLLCSTAVAAAEAKSISAADGAASAREAVDASADVSQGTMMEIKEQLKKEQLKSKALEDENKALRGQVATVLSYLDQVMPMEGEQGQTS